MILVCVFLLLPCVLSAHPDLPCSESVSLFEKTYTRLQKQAESQMLKKNNNNGVILQFFKRTHPKTAEGWIQYGRALLQNGKTVSPYKKEIRHFWIENLLSSEQNAQFLQVWGRVLSSGDHEQKVTYLLGTSTPQQPFEVDAQIIMKLIPKCFGDTHELRIAAGLMQLESQWVDLFHNKIHRAHLMPLLRRPYMRFLLRTNRLEEAYQHWCSWKREILYENYKINKDLFSAHFYHIRTLARDLLQHGNTFEAQGKKHVARLWYTRAANVMESVITRADAFPIENSWVAGLIQIHLCHWEKALHHFSVMKQQSFMNKEHVTSSMSKERYYAKASFWSGVCAQKLFRFQEAHTYFETAAKYPFLFYGQMALVRLKRKLTMQFVQASPFYKSRVIKTLIDILDSTGKTRTSSGNTPLVNALIDDLIDHFGSTQECWTFIEVLRKHFPSEAVYLARKLSAHRAQYVFPLAYPTCPLPRSFKDPALVWAIALGETCFCPFVVSSKGALGVMQIMPFEIAKYAAKAGLPYNLKRMNEMSYGMSLGIEEIKEK